MWRGHHGVVEVAELVLKYVQALVWPVVTLALVWSLRAQLRAALTRMTRVETPAGAIEFAAEAREVLDQAQGAADAAPPAGRFVEPPAGFGYPGPSSPWTPLPQTPGYGQVPQQAGGGPPQFPAPAPAAPERQTPEPVGPQRQAPVPAGDAVPACDASVREAEPAEEESESAEEEPASPETPPEGMRRPQPAGPGASGEPGQPGPWDRDQDRDFRLAPPFPPTYPSASASASPSPHPQPQPQAQPYGQPQAYGQPQPYGQAQPYGQPLPYGAPSPSGLSRQPWQEELREARAMIEVSPVGAVVSAWTALDRLCLDVLADVPFVQPGAGRPAEVGVGLAAAGLSQGALDSYDRLRLLRNRAVHGAGDVTAGAARDFVDSCRAVGREVAALRRP